MHRFSSIHTPSNHPRDPPLGTPSIHPWSHPSSPPPPSKALPNQQKLRHTNTYTQEENKVHSTDGSLADFTCTVKKALRKGNKRPKKTTILCKYAILIQPQCTPYRSHVGEPSMDGGQHKKKTQKKPQAREISPIARHSTKGRSRALHKRVRKKTRLFPPPPPPPSFHRSHTVSK